MKIKKLTSLKFLIVFFSVQLNAQYVTNDVFSNPIETTNMTRDIFVVWWDNDNDYTAEVDILLDQMIAFKTTCLNDLNMQNPPNPTDGYYYNVYIHDDGGFYDTLGWGNGVGTDSNGYPYYTLPYPAITDLVNLAHETFHAFQYSANSIGFEYQGNSAWYVETSANWFAATQYPDDARALIEAESLVRVPQVPLWLSYGNYPSSYPNNWQRYVHQYALALFLYYLTEEKNVADSVIAGGFYANTTELPQEYLYNQIGAVNYRNYFIDWAAHMTNDFDFITPQQKVANLAEWNTAADSSDDNEFIETFDTNGSNGWYSPNNLKTTNAWAFNTYKLENTSNASYTFHVNGNPTGSYGQASYFQGKVLVKNTNGIDTFYNVPMTNDQQGELNLSLTNSDTEIYFIIASMPAYFEDNSSDFQLFPYQMKITNNSLSVTDFDNTNLIKVYPNPFLDNVEVGFNQIENNIDIELYSILGQKIYQQKFINKKDLSLDFYNVKSGVYFLKISSNNKTNTVKLIKE